MNELGRTAPFPRLSEARKRARKIRWIGLLLVALTAAGLLSPWISPHDPTRVEMEHAFLAPSWEYPLGTDHLGRCVFSRLLSGIRVSVGGALLALSLSVLLGTIIGTISGLRGGKIDALLMRLCDVLLAFPALVLAFALLGVLGAGFVSLIAALVLSQWVYYARIVRGLVLTVKQSDFIMAAKVSGTRRLRLVFRHILPNIAVPLVVVATLDIGMMILEITGFSFLGLGVQAPTAEWGMMIQEGKDYIWRHPELIVFPGLAIMLVVSLFNSLGDSLRNLYDPKER